jgi:hypothetical protein
MANNNWNNYTEKNAALTDKDEIMLRDSTDGKNKRSPLSKIWNYMVDKMATAVISKLETNNKTIIGAINALNSESLIGNVTTIDDITFDYNSFTKTGLYYINGPKNQSESDNKPGENITNCFMMVLAKTDYRCFQIIFPGNTERIFYRNTKTDTSGWNSWKTL